MKRLYTILFTFLSISILTSCGEDKFPNEEYIKLEGLTVEMGERFSLDTKTRATSEFIVNKAQDPTADVTRLTGAGGWILDVKIRDKNGNNYTPGNATCTYVSNAWIPGTDLYFPNYRKPKTEATLYPSGWDLTTSTIALDQRADNLLKQDILVQNGSPYELTPSHKPEITLRHKYSMLDFILVGVNPDDIDQLSVLAGALTYIPYQASGTTNPEYLLILPTGISNPEVHLTTKKGAKYKQTIGISSTAINNCYCVKLNGVELILSSVTVIDWAYGTALEGQYTTVTSYPTFRGIENTTITLYYDNGLPQPITFNYKGEATAIKPVGRSIIRINDKDLPTPIILDKMYIDLRPYLS